jgi:cytochrome o ubiquinol oxidase operon protein cyoD
MSTIDKQTTIRRDDTTILKQYIFGFVSSIALTLAAYYFVVHRVFSGLALAYAIAELAAVQCVLQLFFFLHLSAGTKPRWRLISLLFMLIIVGIVVVGSLWIMHSLSYRMMSPTKITNYMNDQVGL